MKEDTRNFVLFAVLAAIILLGGNLLSSRMFPRANPPATKIVNGKSKVIDTPTGPAATTAATVRALDVVPRRNAAHRDPHRRSARLDQPEGRTDR